MAQENSCCDICAETPLAKESTEMGVTKAVKARVAKRRKTAYFR